MFTKTKTYTSLNARKINASITDIILEMKTHLIRSDSVFSLAVKEVQIVFEVSWALEQAEES